MRALKVSHPELSGIGIPDAVEKYFGDSAEAGAVEQSGGILQNPRAQAYVNAIGQKLVAHSDRKNYGYKFGIVSDPNLNAFALPNGSIYVTVGLLKSLRTEAQLANVLGHEVSHVTEHHTVEQMGVNFGTLGLLGLAGKFLKKSFDKDDVKEARGLVHGLITNGYSRGDESQADEVGQKLAAEAGWDPMGMVDVMTVFSQLEQASKKDDQLLEAYMRSHPYADERVKAAAKRVSSLRIGRQNEVGGDRYRDFLVNQLGVPEDQVEMSPIQMLTRDPFILPGLALLGVGALFAIWYITRD